AKALLSKSEARLHCRHRSPIDHILRSADRRRERRSQKRDQIRDFRRLRRTTEWNAAERLHDDRLAAFVVGARLSSETFRQCDGGLRFYPAGRYTYDADAFLRHFLRQRFAIRR